MDDQKLESARHAECEGDIFFLRFPQGHDQKIALLFLRSLAPSAEELRFLPGSSLQWFFPSTKRWVIS